MSETMLTLFGTALIVAVPALIAAVMGRSTRRQLDATHAAVQVLNGNEHEEPLGPYIHKRFHEFGTSLTRLEGHAYRTNELLERMVSTMEQD